MNDRVIEGPFRVALCALLLAVSVFYAYEALSFHPLAMYAPLAAGAVATVLMSMLLAREVVRLVRTSRGDTRSYATTAEATSDALTVKVLGISVLYLAVMVAYVAATYVIGMVIASAVVLTLLLHFDAKAAPRFTAISVASVLLAFYLFGTFAELQWPQGLAKIPVFG
ncbi:hypothetical protein E4P42_16985 [Mycobacterium sp. PS03-16]|uniref:tripartite tricarboxylate transporter TctB family protein n=1 Tax=Mycobacterium sp. PS03-16 TaxID=2559611 RepID=UPI0010737B2F|nr:tripartite tricarboxylate transporter TctB family protein [Mycobacterium sp. PS03-16]TFV57092.1 hypothetical protein E4P42_16985 [Mycobacterium sp. PS03-16]